LRDVMTYETEDGDRAGMAFIEPRSKDDLRRRAAAFAAWAEATCGLIGRSPDYMNACMMMVGAAAVHLGAHDPVFGERARNIYLDARRRDLCFTHTFIPAHVDRNRPPSEQPASLRVLRETSEGPIVSGARVVATLAPFSDANLVILGGPLNLENDPGAESMAIAFTCPANAPGLRWSCRDVLDHERPLYDAPLAGRIDEQDALAIFEEVLVPWENVFVYRDLEIYNRQFQHYRLNESLGHQVLIKNIAKTRFLFGLAHLIAESKQINGFINVQERLGDFVIFLANLEALAIAAVEGAVQDPANGLWYANPRAVYAGLRLYPEYYPKMIDHLIQLGASDFVVMPPAGTLAALGDDAEHLFAGAAEHAREKVALFRLAWDVAGSGWGGRQELYERFFFGDTTIMKAQGYLREDKTAPAAMVQRLLRGNGTPEQPFPVD
ncbi:MAG TPA: 4-hydroxyphenylacetate 3-hydroxylase N-terminal domain-containing protein, partial [Dehalococcoidia bacterium]|nr:4-hydroxyphenylacetate 3-hydroxylase N-terminal domain-containing protein [Dehalococcoidia bacterium]